MRDLEDPRRPAADYDERLTRAQKDIAENWRQYRANMELMERATEQREG